MVYYDTSPNKFLLQEEESFENFVKSFLFLNDFGFSVKKLIVTVTKEDNVFHFSNSCEKLTVNKIFEGFNAVNFFKNITATGSFSKYCNFCYQKCLKKSTGSVVSFVSNILPLKQMVLYTNEPITDLRFFHTVASAFETFRQQSFHFILSFSYDDGSLFETVLKEQEKRLQDARVLFSNDVSLLESEMKNLVKNSVWGDAFNNFDMVSKGVVLYHAKQFQFDGSSVSRFSEEFKFENKILNVIEELFVDKDNVFFFAPLPFIKLWCSITQLFSGSVVTHESILFKGEEFMETFKVLAADENLFYTSGVPNSKMFAFDVKKFKQLCLTTTLLIEN